MSRPRPPLHDPYGLLRPPPPLETPSSLYSAAPNTLSSTVSLPLPVGSPSRRTRQRGVSPSRTLHGEEYDDQPYLTNAVRHHGQVTLVPPVNQGRTRKVKRKRNVEAAASTSSLAETVAARPVSSAGPSRANNQSRLNESPRRPRQGSEARTISSPEFRSTSYPDYPPPSFEEVLALDRRNPSTTPVPPSDNRPVTQPASSLQPRIQVPTAPPEPPRNATPWEQDRLRGLSLEERVQREFERTLKSGDATPSGLDSGARSTSPCLAPGTPTSVAASNFLTPQNLTPSTPRVSLPESDPPRGDVSRTPSPPPVPPKPSGSPHDSPLGYDEASLRREPMPSPDPTEAQVPEPADQRVVISTSTGSLSHAPPSSKSTQASPSSSETPLESLLFTTRLRLDESPEASSATKLQIDDSPSREGHPQDVVENTPLLGEGRLWKSPQNPSLPLEPTGTRVIDDSPERRTDSIFEELARSSGSRGRSPSRTVITPYSPTRSVSPMKPSEPVIPESAPTTRRPPPPPPRRVGAGVAARISAYEALLAKAPKVAPPLPPRPRPQSQTSTSIIHGLDTPIVGSSKPGTPAPAVTSPSAREPSEHSAEGRSQLATTAHTATSPSLPAASRPFGSPPQDPRPLGAQPRDPVMRASPEPEPQINRSRPLPAPPIPSASRRVPSPEHTQVAAVQPQVLVPARIRSDGRIEIIPDADVIWLDRDAPKPNAGALTRDGIHREGAPGTLLENGSGPSNQESYNPFEDSFSSLTTNPPDRAQPISPARSPSPIPTPSVPQPEQHVSPPARLADDFEYTDLDLLVSRLEENEAARQGANYEQLLAVGEVLGPAHPPASRPELDLNVGLIEIQRRRVMKDGRVKLKLSLMGVGVDKCGICLTQFKNNESAVLLTCLHSFHTNCIMSWFVRQETPACPHCRTPVTPVS